MYSEIENHINKCYMDCWKYGLNQNKVFIGNEYLVFFNDKTNKYLCYKHSFENTLIEYLLNCGNDLYVLNCDKVYLFDDKFIKENVLMKYESIVH